MTTPPVRIFYSYRFIVPVLILVTLAVFSPVLWFDFVDFDDPVYVLQNPLVQGGVTLKAIMQAFTSPYEVNWIPLTWISHMLDVQLFGMNPMWHHAVSLLLHTASTSVLFLFLRRATGAPLRSAAVAFLFALHPLHVESVAWVSERKDVLSAFFGILTMHAYLRYTESRSPVRYMGVLFFFILGLMAKPMLIMLPVVLLFMDWWPFESLQRVSVPPAPLRLFIEKIPFIVLSACSAIITLWAQSSDGNLTQTYTLSARAGRAFISYLIYLWMTVWPADLAVLYPFEKYPPRMYIMLGALAVLVALSVVTFLMRNRYPYLLAGWGWYVTMLVPVIGFVQIGQHSVADRYTYLPLIGIFIIAVWGACDVSKRLNIDNRVLSALTIVIMLVMASLTSMQLQHWRNTLTLFSRAVAVTTGNWVAHYNLGLSLLNGGKVDEAITHFIASIQAKPSYALAFKGLGVARHKKGEYRLAIEAYKSALMFGPHMLESRLGIGLVHLDENNVPLAMAEYNMLRDAGSPYAEELLQTINSRLAGNK